MPGLLLEMEPPPVVAPPKPEYGFSLLHQKLDLDINFATQSLSGRTEITIVPQHNRLTSIKIDARQCRIPPNKVLVNGAVAKIQYQDPYDALNVPEQYVWGAEHYELQKDRLKPLVSGAVAEGALVVHFPPSVRIQEVDPFSDGSTIVVAQRGLGALPGRQSVALEGTNGAVSTPSIQQPRTAIDQSSKYAPITITIPFATKHLRDGMQFVGMAEGDARYPHVYTKHSLGPGLASCIFPCIDDPVVRCTWDISIKCSKTLGDALKKPVVVAPKSHHHKKHQAAPRPHAQANGVDHDEVQLSEEDKLLEMTVVCSGELIDEVVDLENGTKKTVSFSLVRNVAAQHIGFAIGPFEQIDLSEFREEEDAEKLGQGQAVQVSAFSLPGRADEVRYTCATMASAVDYFSLNFGKYDFSDCKMCFVDDQVPDTVSTASLSFCSTRLLFPDNIINPEMENTRSLVCAIASQWMGVAMVPQARTDIWIVVGISHFMTSLFMKTLCGTNEYMFRQKTLMDRLVEEDVGRPGLSALGAILSLGSFEYDFMALKAPLVLFILDRRMMKSMGSVGGLTRIVNKMISAANTGGESMVSTESFGKLCYKISKYKCETFFNQWVLAAGCPRFHIAQRFNKKRLCVELSIAQKQDGASFNHKLNKGNFLREFKEEASGVWSEEPQSVFTGPMTIRIHEADGTPYEHIVEIREGNGKFEIPYNTKYKRLKRSRRQKERANAAAGIDITADNQDDVLIYCLGDVLQNRDEVREWDLRDWDAETEADMDKESYEWIRIDADFEWLCDLHFASMKPYMYVSQLQQDRDVVAQQDSITFLGKADPHPLVSTFLIRTVMDRRYFHGIRTMAAECLKTHATKNCDWIGQRHLEKAFQEFFCYPGTRTPKSNDFSDKKAYYVLCAIPRAMAKIRNSEGNCPKDARQFILDQLRFNDNGNNEYSDNHYVANLLTALADCLIPTKKNGDEVHFGDEDEEFDPEPKQFQESVIEEIDRYRRMDEWIHSYQNIYTTTALDCKQKLMKAGVIPTDPVEFVQYLHDGTADLVRIKAFEALVDLGFLTNDTVVEYLLTVMSTDSSPFVRRRLFEVFCYGLATIAFGENKTQEAPAPAVEEDGLVVERGGEALMAARQAQIARTKDIIGAIEALKDELKDHTALKTALWKAIKSPVIGISEQCDLLDICWMLYDVEDEFVVNLKLPRYWEAENLGKGTIKFKQTDKVRGRISKYTMSKIKPPTPPPPPVPESKPIPKPAVAPSVALPQPPPVMHIPLPPALPIAPPPVTTPQPLKINFKAAKPSISSGKPTTPIVKPVVNAARPASNLMKPANNTMKPASNPMKPAVNSVKTTLNPVKPATPHSGTISVKTPTIKTPGPPKASTFKTKSEEGQMRPPKRPRSPEPITDSIKVERLEGQPKKKIVKLKIADFSKVLQIQSRPRNPAPPKLKKQRSNSNSVSHHSPVVAPRPSPAPSSTSSLKGASPAPAPRKSKVVVLKYGEGRLNLGRKPNGEGERKPLPDTGRKPLPDTGRKPLPDTGGRKPLPDTTGRKPLPESLPKRPLEPPRRRQLVVKLPVPSLYQNPPGPSSSSKPQNN